MESKFDIGQKVFLIQPVSNRRYVRCSACDYTGRILLKGKSYDCPNCRGGKRTDYVVN